MTYDEVRQVLGPNVELIPFARGYPAPPTEYQKIHDAIYAIPVARMGVELQLNRYTNVIRIDYCIGKDAILPN